MTHPQGYEIESFSGTHPFTPACLELAGVNTESINDIVAALTLGWCPRCYTPLPELPIRPAGSRVTRCRCVPICGACGEHEAYVPGLSADQWPLSAQAIRAHLDDILSRASTGILQVRGEDLVLVTDHGASPVRMRENPGGWAEFGHEATEGGAR